MRVQLKTKIKYSCRKRFEIYIDTNDRLKMPLLFSVTNHISLSSAYLIVFFNAYAYIDVYLLHNPVLEFLSALEPKLLV